jgi:hypothetical protein
MNSGQAKCKPETTDEENLWLQLQEEHLSEVEKQ